jgi:hypothetical protein
MLKRITILEKPVRISVLEGGSPTVVNVVRQTVRLQTVRQGPPGAIGPPGAALPPTNFAFGDASPALVQTLDAQKLVVRTRITITTPFDGAGATLSIGTLAQPELLIASSQVNPAQKTTFETTPEVALSAGTNLYLFIIAGVGATQGAGRTVLELIPV